MTISVLDLRSGDHERERIV